MSSPMVGILEYFNLGCHGEQKKCLHVGGRHMQICARCTGCIIGHCSALISAFIFSFGTEIYFIAASFLFVMYSDWLFQNKFNWYHSNISRLITGIMGGFAVAISIITITLELFR